MAMTDELKSKCNLACQTADEFMKLFYERMDSKRHTIGKLYLDSSQISWNGHRIAGSNAIAEFLMNKVPTSEHEIISLDAQPVFDAAVHGQKTIAVTIAGTVRYETSENAGRNDEGKSFQQNFLLTAEGDKWKVASESFRYQD